MNLVNLSYLNLNLNAAIDAGDRATMGEAKAHIRNGDVLARCGRPTSST